MDGFSEDPIIVKVKYDVKDIEQIIKFHRSSGRILYAIFMYMIITLIILVLSSYMTDLTDIKINVKVGVFQYDLLSLIPYTLIVFVVVLGERWRKRFIIQNYIHCNKFLREEMEFTFTDEKIEYSSESSAARMKWDVLYCIGEIKNAVMIFITDRNFIFIPKRFFEGNNFERFASLAYSRLPKKKVNKVLQS